MATEVEIKLHMKDVSQIEDIINDEEIRSSMREDFRRVNMCARYYDTPDWDLYKAGYMLRIRSEDERVIVSLKRGTIDKAENIGLCIRQQWICEIQEIEGAIGNLRACGAPREIEELTAGKELVNICYDEFIRTSAILYLEDGIVLELAMDTGVTHAGSKTGEILEMELEVIFGNINAVRPFCEALSMRLGLMPETTTKYEKSYALAIS